MEFTRRGDHSQEFNATDILPERHERHVELHDFTQRGISYECRSQVSMI